MCPWGCLGPVLLGQILWLKDPLCFSEGEFTTARRAPQGCRAGCATSEFRGGAGATPFPARGAPCSASALLFWENCKCFSYFFFFFFNVKFKASTGLLRSLSGDVVVAVVLCRWCLALGEVQLFE